MSTLAEVETAASLLSIDELARLEHFVRKARLAKMQGTGKSPLDLAPLDLGAIRGPLGTREEWYDEML